jgi:hypothetical protein
MITTSPNPVKTALRLVIFALPNDDGIPDIEPARTSFVGENSITRPLSSTEAHDFARPSPFK